MIESGNLAEWVGSVGTVLTLALGVGILSREVRDNRKRHAGGVAAWIDGDAGVVHVKNGAAEPVTRVMVALFSAPDHYAEPFSGQIGHPWVMSWDWLGPGQTVDFAPEPVDWSAHLFPPQVRIEFTDTTNRRWLRNEQGRLSRKRVIPFRQDFRSIPFHWRNARVTDSFRKNFTRWRWPNL